MHWIQNDVLAQLPQVAVPIHHDHFEAALQDLDAPVVTAGQDLGGDAVELAHRFRQIGLGRFHHQMEVVVQQAVGVQQKMKTGDDARQDSKKAIPVFVIQEDVLLGVAPG